MSHIENERALARAIAEQQAHASGLARSLMEMADGFDSIAAKGEPGAAEAAIAARKEATDCLRMVNDLSDHMQGCTDRINAIVDAAEAEAE